MTELYSSRIERIQERMRQEGCTFLILGPTPNTFYFTGLQTHADERLQVVIIPAEGRPFTVLPEMYRETAGAALPEGFLLYAWSDRQDPMALLKNAAGEGAAGRIAVDDTLRADHFMQIMRAFPGARFEQASRIVDALRMFKDDEEIGYMEKAGEIADRVMEKVRHEIRPGISEKELALYVEVSFKQLCDNISFKPIVASGPNSASPHHSSGERKLREGDFIVVDCGGQVGGYCSDITRTFFLGRADVEMKKVYRVVQDANQAAFEALGGLCSGEDADDAARNVIVNAGYGSYFTHRTGHGIGLEVHEAPYLVQGNKTAVTPGMAFSIEPGIYIQGKYGIRIEDIVAMTKQGPRRLNNFSRDLLEL